MWLAKGLVPVDLLLETRSKTPHQYFGCKHSYLLPRPRRFMTEQDKFWRNKMAKDNIILKQVDNSWFKQPRIFCKILSPCSRNETFLLSVLSWTEKEERGCIALLVVVDASLVVVESMKTLYVPTPKEASVFLLLLPFTWVFPSSGSEECSTWYVGSLYKCPSWCEMPLKLA